MADRVSQSVSKGLADLVLNDDDFLDQPTFQKAAHEGAGLVEVAKEADQETAGDSAGAENIGWVIGGDGLASPRKIGKDGQSERIEAPGPDGKPAAKVVIVGDAGTGKTCLLRRLCGEEFSGNSKATVGVDPSHEYVSRVYLGSVVPNGGAISGLKLFGLKLYSPVSPCPFQRPSSYGVGSFVTMYSLWTSLRDLSTRTRLSGSLWSPSQHGA